MTSSQSIDEFFTLGNGLLLKLRIAESYATRPHELTTVCTIGDESAGPAIELARKRLVDRRDELAGLEAEIRTSLNELRAAFIALKTEYGASLKELDGYKPTGHTIAFEALQSATYDVCRWIGETLAWLRMADRLPVGLNPQTWRQCDATADSFPIASNTEAAIRKQLWHEQAVLTDRAELKGIEEPATTEPAATATPVEQVEQRKIKLPTNPDVAEVWNVVQAAESGTANVAEICRSIAEKRGCNADSLRSMFNTWRRKNIG